MMQGAPVNLHSIVQQNPLSPYIPGVAGQTTAYMASRGGSVPGFPVGIGGGGILPGQPSLRAPTHAQHQVLNFTILLPSDILELLILNK